MRGPARVRLSTQRAAQLRSLTRRDRVTRIAPLQREVRQQPMTTIKRMTVLVGLVAIALFGAIRVASADAAAEVAALHAADDTFIKAYNGSDADTLAGLYDEHAVLLPPGAKAQHGKAAIKAYFVKDVAESAKQGVILVIDPKPA